MSEIQRPRPDADPYLQYIAGALRALDDNARALQRRVDGLEAAIGELRTLERRAVARERDYAELIGELRTLERRAVARERDYAELLELWKDEQRRRIAAETRLAGGNG